MSEDNPLKESILPLLGIPFEAEGIPLYQPLPPFDRIVYPYYDLDEHVFRSIAKQAGTLQVPQGVDFSLSKQEIVTLSREIHPEGDGSIPAREQWGLLSQLYDKEFPRIKAKYLHRMNSGEILSSFRLPYSEDQSRPGFYEPFLLISPEDCPEWLADRSESSQFDKSCRRAFVSTIIRTESLRDCGFFIFGHFFNVLVKPNFLDVSLTKTLLLSPSSLLVFNLS